MSSEPTDSEAPSESSVSLARVRRAEDLPGYRHDQDRPKSRAPAGARLSGRVWDAGRVAVLRNSVRDHQESEGGRGNGAPTRLAARANLFDVRQERQEAGPGPGR